MKPFSAALAASVLLLAPSAFAQGAVDRPSPEAELAAEVPLIPEEVTPTSKPRGTALPQVPAGGFKKSKTDVSMEEQRERIRYRQARTKAERDAQVQAHWEEAVEARTDLEKREALKRYYKALFTRMTRLDGSIKRLIVQREAFALRRLEQTRIDSTQPLNYTE